MIVKTPGSQVGSPTAAEKGGEVRGGGRGGGEERRGVLSKSTAPKARSRSKDRRGHECSAEDFSESVREITVAGIVVIVTAVGRHCAHADISMPGCSVDIYAYIGLLVGIIKARGWTTSRSLSADTNSKHRISASLGVSRLVCLLEWLLKPLINHPHET